MSNDPASENVDWAWPVTLMSTDDWLLPAGANHHRTGIAPAEIQRLFTAHSFLTGCDNKLAQPGMSNVNPLDQPEAKEKPKPTVPPV